MIQLLRTPSPVNERPFLMCNEEGRFVRHAFVERRPMPGEHTEFVFECSLCGLRRVYGCEGMMSPVDITGRRFGRFAVIGPAETKQSGVRMWLCLCDCGNTKMVRGDSLRSGRSRSCGCLHSDIVRAKGRRRAGAWGLLQRNSTRGQP